MATNTTRVLRARKHPSEDVPGTNTSVKRKATSGKGSQGTSQSAKRAKIVQNKTSLSGGRKQHASMPSSQHKSLDKAAATQGTKTKLDDQSTTRPISNPSDDKGYWLMKAEQEDREVQVKSGATINTKFTIEDLRTRDKPEPWDGVRNFVARNNMRSMKLGDLAFFYASGGTGKTKPGITGIMTVVKEHEPDWTMYDENAYGFVEPDQRGSDKEPKWSLVHVDFKEQLSKPVTLAELRAHSQPGQPLADMQLLRNGRISVSKVSAAEWEFITQKLMQAS